MRSRLPGEPIFVHEHAGEPLALHDVPVPAAGGGVTFSGFQLNLIDQKLIDFSINFLQYLAYIRDVSLQRGQSAPPVATLATTGPALTAFLGRPASREVLFESLGRVMLGRLRLGPGGVLAPSLLEGYRLYKKTDDIHLRLNLDSAVLFKECLAGAMLIHR